MPSELASLLKSLDGKVLRHYAGKRRRTPFLKIGILMSDAQGQSRLKPVVAKQRNPVTTTVFIFPTKEAAQHAVSEGFRHAGRRNLLHSMEIYAGTFPATKDKIVVNFFTEGLAREWERAIGTRRRPKPFRRYPARQIIKRMKRD